MNKVLKLSTYCFLLLTMVVFSSCDKEEEDQQQSIIILHDNITATSMDVRWNTILEAEYYGVEYSVKGSLENYTVYYTEGTSFSFSELEADTEYEITVVAWKDLAEGSSHGFADGTERISTKKLVE